MTAPLTEVIDHAGYFIQMSMASLPIWLEGILNRKYPKWRELEYNADGSARHMPAGVRVVEAALPRHFPASDIAVCFPDALDRFVGPETRVVAVSTHNPLGVTRATLDLIYEVEPRGLFAFFIPSIFTPLHDTRMAEKIGVTETRQLTPLQWQLMMKCWKMNRRPGQASWWAPTAWRAGSIALWLWKLRTLNGPGFTWPAPDVRQRAARAGDVEYGEALSASAAPHQVPQGAAGGHQAAAPAVPAGRHGRFAGRHGQHDEGWRGPGESIVAAGSDAADRVVLRELLRSKVAPAAAGSNPKRRGLVTARRVCYDESLQCRGVEQSGSSLGS